MDSDSQPSRRVPFVSENHRLDYASYVGWTRVGLIVSQMEEMSEHLNAHSYRFGRPQLRIQFLSSGTDFVRTRRQLCWVSLAEGDDLIDDTLDDPDSEILQPPGPLGALYLLMAEAEITYNWSTFEPVLLGVENQQIERLGENVFRVLQKLRKSKIPPVVYENAVYATLSNVRNLAMCESFHSELAWF
jgi:hypothetical protein